MAGPCRLRNISVKIISDNDNHVVPGNACAGEIILGNPFLKASGLDVKDFLADNIERLSAIDYGNLEVEERTAKVGKLGLKLLSNDIGMAEGEIEPTKLCSMMSNDNFPLKDGDDIDYKDVEVGIQNDNEIQKEIDTMISRREKHLDKDSRSIMRSMVYEFKDIFRVKLGKDPPVNVEPMKIELEGPTRPIKVRQRTYSPEQTLFLKQKVKDLTDAGYIVRNNTSKWACAPLIVPKPGKEGFRFTVDLRPVNAQTKKAVWPMPHAYPMLAKLTGSKVWFNLDSHTDIGNFPWRKVLANANHSIQHSACTHQLVCCTVQSMPFHISNHLWNHSSTIWSY